MKNIKVREYQKFGYYIVDVEIQELNVETNEFFTEV